MPRYGETRYDATRCGARRPNNTAGEPAASHRTDVSLVRRAAALLLKASIFSMAALPLAYAQHGSSSHPPAPQMSQPRMSAPQKAPMQAPRQSYRPPAYGAPARPGYAPRPYPGAPNRFTPAPIPPGPPSAYRPGAGYPVRAPYGAPPPSNTRGPHLGNWLQNHQGESFVSQENSLRREPGFNHLPQPQQQRLIDRLHQLDSMPPQKRQRTLGRIENMERLSPDRRQAIRGSAQELSGMDFGRQQQVRGAFRVLREMPPGQREQVLNSPAYRSMYSDHERQILGNLLSVEPYQPR